MKVYVVFKNDCYLVSILDGYRKYFFQGGEIETKFSRFEIGMGGDVLGEVYGLSIYSFDEVVTKRVERRSDERGYLALLAKSSILAPLKVNSIVGDGRGVEWRGERGRGEGRHLY
jgi:hypothetical protein